MATASPVSASASAKIPIRKIGANDLRDSLRQGLEDFRDMRGEYGRCTVTAGSCE